MKKPEKRQDQLQEQPKEQRRLKEKLVSATAMLLVATILMVTTSYAWFVLSTAPEVTGIDTQVGSNGSLEIALLNTETRTNMSLIRSGAMGDSLAENNLAANNAWGNLIDLGYSGYGLGEILLMPTRLSTAGNAENGYTVDMSKPLQIPTYGYDGRVVGLTDNTLSAVYQNGEFSYVTGVQDYGVRAIGTSEYVTVQESALNSAKGNIPVYTKSAGTNAQSALSNNGEAIFSIMLNHMSGDAESYTNEDRDALKSLLNALDTSVYQIDAAMRQGLVAYAASALDDEDTFSAVKTQILDTGNSLSSLLNSVSSVGSVPAEFTNWVNALAEIQNNLNAAVNRCNAMTSGSYTWEEIRGVLNYIMDVDHVYIEDKLFANVDQAAIINKVMNKEEITMTLAPGSGIFADIADFAGNYSQSITVMSMASMLIETVSTENPAYLNALASVVNELEAAGGGVANVQVPLSTTYGYALDLAFRCNVENPDLVLQTKGVQRVYSDSESTSTQGGGSYMEFNSSDASLSMEQKLQLMDAIRVGFVDAQGNLLGVAKLNISNYVVEDGMINAPLYLYHYSFSEEDGSMIIGDRRMTDNLITDNMQQNVAMALTVVVWLDGDLVDNSMVSATEAASLSGVLNLQFATSAELVPAYDGQLMSYTADKASLATAVQQCTDVFDAGQGAYTNVSWNAFAAAYNRAVAVNENDNASGVEVSTAVRTLAEAYSALTEVSTDAITQKAQSVRDMMGTVTDEVGSIVIKNADGTYSAVGNEEHTQDEHDSWDIVGELNRVDYNKNLESGENNDLYTPIYSDESWNALAMALYQAEAVAMNENATEDEINAALTALENAEKALTRQVFFTSYEYRGDIYFKAICDAEKEDTYGSWYDSNFQRIVSDVMILNLDAYAEPVQLSQLSQNTYVSSDATYITPDIDFLEQVYPELRDVEVLGVHWNEIDSELFIELMTQTQYSKLSELVYMVNTDTVLNYAMSDECTTAGEAANELITKWNNNEDVLADDARTCIQSLNDAIIELYATNTEKMKAESTAMTDNQRTLLIAAVNSAKAVEGYSTKDELANLRAAAESAENLLTAGSAVTKEQANTALANLNTELKAAGAKEITEGNTLTHKLPDGFGADDIVYNVDYPGIRLKLTGQSGKTTIGAKVLTTDGVVITVEKEITIYDRADGVKLSADSASLSLSDTKSADLAASLLYEAGGVNTGDKALADLVKETIKSCTWASTDTSVATVSTTGTDTASVTAVGAGTAKVTVSVETVAGNFYYYEIPVIVAD